jgi:hypothetical protein
MSGTIRSASPSRNDGSVTDRFAVRATGASSAWVVTYARGSTNITSAGARTFPELGRRTVELRGISGRVEAASIGG